MHVGLGDHVHEGLLPAPARVDEAGQVAVLAKPWNRQIKRSYTSLQGTRPVAVALDEALGVLLAVLGSREAAHFSLHVLP